MTPTLRGGSPGGSTHGKPSGTDQGPFVVRNSGRGYWQEDEKAAPLGTEAARVHESILVAYGGNRTSGPIDQATACNAHGGTGRCDFESETFVVGPLCANAATDKKHGDGGISSLQQYLSGHIIPVPTAMLVRRLTPRECERLQGFPDDWTAWGIDEKGKRVAISDSARYRMLGNAVTVNVAEWIGRRIMESKI